MVNVQDNVRTTLNLIRIKETRLFSSKFWQADTELLLSKWSKARCLNSSDKKERTQFQCLILSDTSVTCNAQTPGTTLSPTTAFLVLWEASQGNGFFHSTHVRLHGGSTSLDKSQTQVPETICGPNQPQAHHRGPCQPCHEAWSMKPPATFSMASLTPWRATAPTETRPQHCCTTRTMGTPIPQQNNGIKISSTTWCNFSKCYFSELLSLANSATSWLRGTKPPLHWVICTILPPPPRGKAMPNSLSPSWTTRFPRMRRAMLPHFRGTRINKTPGPKWTINLDNYNKTSFLVQINLLLRIQCDYITNINS